MGNILAWSVRAHGEIKAPPPDGMLPSSGGAPSASTTGDSENEGVISPENIVTTHGFFILVTVEWTERVKVLATTLVRRRMHRRTLQINSRGGMTHAPITQDDADWKMVQDQLHAQVIRTKGRLESICVSFDLDQMDGYKNHKRAVSPPGHDSEDAELAHGTHVPSLGSFSPENLKVSEAAKEIKAAWHCEKGPFFCLTKDPPPDQLLDRWNVDNHRPAESCSGKVPRGRSGPGHAPATSVDASTNILLSTMVPVMTMLTQNMAGSSSRNKASRHHSPSSSPVRQSSPPPPVEDELVTFLKAFGKAKPIPSEKISIVSECLQEIHYYLDIISDITFERLKELTDLAEGEVLALCEFACEWSGQMDAKRAKLKKH
ncbi:hypothetical protein M413DRAFT_10427 [Hebeloma cylindrosporum]|uniref:Uncharacterized protein n=1 Tax=Hebeloma cylindrosporum TaxID=76867 RepID=A0A0C3CDC8_HEBCY|nr:hypothetical protein M413DRAFT_10427 [Hebeloma cylindrosporum h7]